MNGEDLNAPKPTWYSLGCEGMYCKEAYKNYLDALATQKEVYGAIWTDKGLIYVAKMNEKRELELL